MTSSNQTIHFSHIKLFEQSLQRFFNVTRLADQGERLGNASFLDVKAMYMEHLLKTVNQHLRMYKCNPLIRFYQVKSLFL